MGQNRHFSSSTIPRYCRAPAVPQHSGKGTKRLLSKAGGPRLRFPLVATLQGFSTFKHESGPDATISLHLPAPTPIWQHRHMVLPNTHHCCCTAEESGPRPSTATPVHPQLISPFQFVTLPHKGKKWRNKSVSCHISNSLWALKLSAVTVTSNR